MLFIHLVYIWLRGNFQTDLSGMQKTAKILSKKLENI